MARRNLRTALWSALTRRLQTWADLARRQAEKARLAAEESAGAQIADSAAERQPGEPPIHWLERADHRGPPDYWLEHVRERAPHLLDGDRLPGETLVVAEATTPPQRATRGRPVAAKPAARQAEPLRLIPQAKPTEKPVVEEQESEEHAAKEALAAPVARERHSERQASAIRLEPKPVEETVPDQVTQAVPTAAQAQPPPPSAPQREESAASSPPPLVPSEKAPVTSRSLPPRPSRDRYPVHKSEQGQQDIVSQFEAADLARPALPIPPPQSPPRELQLSAPDLTTPPNLPPKREQGQQHTEPARRTEPVRRTESVRWVAFQTRHVSTPSALAPQQQAQEETAEPGFGQGKGTQESREKAPEKDHWPPLPDAAFSIPDDGEAARRAWQRLQRLEQEQRGYLWNESHF